MIYRGRTDEFLQLETINNENYQLLKDSVSNGLTILWVKSSKAKLIIDAKPYHLRKDQICFLTEFHEIEVQEIPDARLVRFNRPFYCILDHDDEVGCKGVLFFGASKVPTIYLESEYLEKYEILWKMFLSEMTSSDHLQLEMLQMMLKRLLILSTRLYKQQSKLHHIDSEQIEIIREYNFLVEKHFKFKHTVAEYAQMLYKSPKTLSNLFLKMGDKSPLQYIHDRKMLEARRLLRYSDMPVSDIAFEIGFNDVQSFSRFFKKQEGVSPTAYRKGIILSN